MSSVADGVRPNFETGECECGDFNQTRVRHIVPGDRTSMCAAVTDTYDPRTFSLQFRVDCVSFNMPFELYSRDMLWCNDTIFNVNTDNAELFTVPGSFPRSGNGIDEVTWRFMMDIRDRATLGYPRPQPET